MIKFNKLFIPYIVLLVVIGFRGELVVAFATVLIHEMAHYGTALFLGFQGFAVEFLPIGTVLKLKGLEDASPKEDFIISCSGPLANFILAGIFFVLCNNMNFTYCCSLYYSNLALGIFNMIPAFPLDGGRMLRDFLSTKMIYKKANEVATKVGILIGIFFMFYYIVLFFNGKNNLNIGLIALFVILSSYKENERITYLIMGDIIKKRYRFIKKGYIENKSISIYLKESLLNALGILDKNKYNIFTVLDDEMKVIDVIYEEELLEGLKMYGNLQIEEFIKIREENL